MCFGRLIIAHGVKGVGECPDPTCRTEEMDLKQICNQ